MPGLRHWEGRRQVRVMGSSSLLRGAFTGDIRDGHHGGETCHSSYKATINKNRDGTHLRASARIKASHQCPPAHKGNLRTRTCQAMRVASDKPVAALRP